MSAKSLNILIVDDSFEDREILKRYLKKIEDFDVTIDEAKDVEQGMALIEKQEPDLMFIDYNMPGESGLDLLERLRKIDQFEFPIIMLTGEGNESIAVAAMKTGVGDYLIKDEINPNSIRLAVIATLDRFDMEKTIQMQRHQLEVAARTDGLTGLWNRRYFDEQLEMEMERAQRYNLQLSLAMADLDHFKKVNDLYGHLVGDAVLIGFSDVLKQALRMSDFAARYGGEEFCIILPNIDLEKSSLAFCRIANDLRARKFKNNKGKSFNITASFGIVQYTKEAFDTPGKFIEAADKALYYAKENGRDKVVTLDADGQYTTCCLD